MELHNEKRCMLLLCVLAVLIPDVTPCLPWHDTSSDYSAEWAANKAICGTKVDNGKIVGGDDVGSVDTWPWVASLYIDGNFACTGELVAKKWVTIAGHCLVDDDNVPINDLSGLQLRFDQVQRGIGWIYESRGVKQFFIHHLFSCPAGGIPRNDFAIIELNSALEYSSSVRPICLPTPDTDYTYNSCWAVGWGQVDNDGVLPLPNKLQELKMTTMSSSACQAAVPATWMLDDSHICAEAATNPDGHTSFGDSGGPLMCKVFSTSTQWVLLGANSFGNFPDVFARVSKFSQWITDCIDEYGGP